MTVQTKNKLHVSAEELSKILKAYNTIGEFLETFLDRRVLYKDAFISGLDHAIKEVKYCKTKRIRTFADFIS